MNAGVTQVETGGRSAVFMNRDGTLIEDCGWLKSAGDVRRVAAVCAQRDGNGFRVRAVLRCMKQILGSGNGTMNVAGCECFRS